MPFAKPNYMYKDEVETEILEFLSQKFKYDLSGGDQDLNLDMTIEEAEFLTLASDDIKKKAESGELLALTDWMKDYHIRKQNLLVTTYDQLERVLQQVDTMEQEIYDDLVEDVEQLESLAEDGDDGLFNSLSGIQSESRSIRNLGIIEGYLAGHKNEDVESKAQTLKQLMAVRGAALQSKAEIQAILVEKDSEDNLCNTDYLETLTASESAIGASEGAEPAGEALTLMGQVEKTR